MCIDSEMLKASAPKGALMRVRFCSQCDYWDSVMITAALNNKSVREVNHARDQKRTHRQADHNHDSVECFNGAILRSKYLIQFAETMAAVAKGAPQSDIQKNLQQLASTEEALNAHYSEHRCPETEAPKLSVSGELSTTDSPAMQA
jgi:hypothetical protein